MTPYYQDNHITLYQGDALTVLRQMPGESVQCVVTSPPYWGLRSYGTSPVVWEQHTHGSDSANPSICRACVCGKSEHVWGEEEMVSTGRRDTGREFFPGHTGNYKDTGPHSAEASQGHYCHHCNAWRGHLGLEPTIEMFIAHLVEIFDEVRRVLRGDGTCWVNIGDSYSGNASSGGPEGQRLESTMFRIKGVPTKKSPGLKPKDLCLIPARLAIALQEAGWYVRSDIIWAKKSPMPESATDRPTNAYEHVFLLSKSARYFYDQDAVREESTASEESIKRYTYGRYEGSGNAARFERTGKPDFLTRQGNNYGELVAEVAAASKEQVLLLQTPIETPDDGSRYTSEQGRSSHRQQHSSSLPELQQQQERQNPPPSMRNQRNVWHLGPEPLAGDMAGKHYAAFPAEIPRRAILAGTSERGACSECGKAWGRVVEKTGTGRVYERGQCLSDHRGMESPQHSGSRSGALSVQITTTGWRPGCSCYDAALDTHPANIVIRELPRTWEAWSALLEDVMTKADTVPCVVLDIFAGVLTTLLVASQLGRRGIGIELSGEYARVGVARVVGDAPLFHQTQPPHIT